MSGIPSLMIERFKRLPRRTHDVWQGGLVRARTWVEDPDGSVRRPWAAVWVSSATGMINMELAERDSADPSVALQALTDLGLKFTRCRPSRLEISDAALGAQLVEALGDPELAVTVRPDLPEVDRVVREAQRSMEEDGPDLPDALDARGVTVERMQCLCRGRARVLHGRTVAVPERSGSHPGGDACRRRWSPIRQRARRRPRDVRPGVLSEPRRVRGSAGGRRSHGPADRAGQVERDFRPARPASFRGRRPVAGPRPCRRRSHGVSPRDLVRSRQAAAARRSGAEGPRGHPASDRAEHGGRDRSRSLDHQARDPRRSAVRHAGDSRAADSSRRGAPTSRPRGSPGHGARDRRDRSLRSGLRLHVSGGSQRRPPRALLGADGRRALHRHHAAREGPGTDVPRVRCPRPAPHPARA